MANKKDGFGFKVNADCIDCGLCGDIAPDIFKRDQQSVLWYVVRQPVTSDEINQAKEALEFCPVDAITNGSQK